MSRQESIHRTVRQWYSNGVGTAFVAAINYINGELFDWAMYVGSGADDEDRLRETVSQHGCKVGRDLAHFLAPGLPIEAYRGN